MADEFVGVKRKKISEIRNTGTSYLIGVMIHELSKVFPDPVGSVARSGRWRTIALTGGVAPMVRIVLSDRSEQANSAAGYHAQRIAVYTASDQGYNMGVVIIVSS